MSFFTEEMKKASREKIVPIPKEDKQFCTKLKLNTLDHSKEISLIELKAKFHNDLTLLKQMSEEFVVDDQETYDRAGVMGCQAKSIYNTIEDSRKATVRPYLDAKKEIDSLAKEYTKICLEIKDGLSEKRLEFENNACSELTVVPISDKNEAGSIRKKQTFVFEIEDLEKVPRKYLQLDEKKVKESLTAGVRSIPGLAIKEEIKEVYCGKRQKK